MVGKGGRARPRTVQGGGGGRGGGGLGLVPVGRGCRGGRRRALQRERAQARAASFFLLSRLRYVDGAPLYRVLDVNASARFVTQWGYSGVPAVDAAWLTSALDNSSEAVAPPGNVRGAVAFGTGSVPGPRPPNCTASECSVGFSVELFADLADNGRLDANGFAPFGAIDDGGMAVLGRAYAGYGECADACAQSGGGPYCVSDGRGGWAGVNLTRFLAEGSDAYLRRAFPRLTYVVRSELLPQ